MDDPTNWKDALNAVKLNMLSLETKVLQIQRDLEKVVHQVSDINNAFLGAVK